MPTVGLIYNQHKSRAGKATSLLAAELEAMGHDVVVVTGEATVMPAVDVLVVLGGDGTFLRGVRLVESHGTPILGVDLGTLGFLSEVTAGEVLDALSRFFSGRYRIEDRVMLRVTLRREGEAIEERVGLNEGVVNKGVGSKLLEFSVFADESQVATYGADGLVVATPTGSTAYALSAGGPIMAPDVPAFVLTPICPHSLTIRPMVISQQRCVRVLIRSCVEGAVLSVDGQVGVPIRPDDEVHFQVADRPARMVKFEGSDFFDRLRQKLQWGGGRESNKG